QCAKTGRSVRSEGDNLTVEHRSLGIQLLAEVLEFREPCGHVVSCSARESEPLAVEPNDHPHAVPFHFEGPLVGVEALQLSRFAPCSEHGLGIVTRLVTGITASFVLPWVPRRHALR